MTEETGISCQITAESRFSHPAATVLPAPFTICVQAIPADATTGPHQHIDMVYVLTPGSGQASLPGYRAVRRRGRLDLSAGLGRGHRGMDVRARLRGFQGRRGDLRAYRRPPAASCRPAARQRCAAGCGGHVSMMSPPTVSRSTIAAHDYGTRVQGGLPDQLDQRSRTAATTLAS